MLEHQKSYDDPPRIANIKKHLVKLIADAPGFQAAENKSEMGKIIANELRKLDPVVDVDELGKIIGSQPMLVIHPHIDGTSISAEEKEVARINLLSEKLAKLIAETPNIAPKLHPGAPSENPKHGNHGSSQNNSKLSEKIADQLIDVEPKIEKNALEQLIKSMPVLVLHPLRKDDEKDSRAVEKKENLHQNPAVQTFELEPHHQQKPIISDRSNGENIHAEKSLVHEDKKKKLPTSEEYTANMHRHLSGDLENPDELMKSKKANHSHLYKDLENGKELEAAKLNHKHKHIEIDLENPEEFEKENLESQEVDRKQFHKHISKDMENVEELLEEEDASHVHIFEDLENPDELVAESESKPVVNPQTLNRKAAADILRKEGISEHLRRDHVVLEESKDRIFGHELMSTQNTMTLRFRIDRDYSSPTPR